MEQEKSPLALPLTFCITRLVLAILGVPLARRRVPRNYLYGVRTPKTLDDEYVWYQANARAGLDLIALGTAMIFVQLVLHYLHLSESGAAFISVSTLLAGTSLVCVRSYRLANRLSQEQHQKRNRSA